MEAKKAILVAIRNALIADSALIALIPAAQIKRANQQAKAVYPCISIRVEGSNGNDFPDAISGDVYITIYALASDASGEKIGDWIDNVYGIVKAHIHNKAKDLSDSNIRIGNIYESFSGSAIPEDEVPNLYYLSARFTFLANS